MRIQLLLLHKIIIFTLVFLVFEIALIKISFAQTASDSQPTIAPTSQASGGITTGLNKENHIANITAAAQKRSDNLTQHITNAKSNADKEIQRRITGLQNLITRLGQMKNLTQTQINSYTSQVQSEISTLTSLQTKIDSDTDPTTLKSDKQSIIDSYRVFAVFIPEINLLAATDKLTTLLNEISAKLTGKQTAINSGGSSNSALTTALSDAQSKLTDAQGLISQAQTELLALTPQGYPGNRSNILDARSKVQSVINDIKGIASDIATINSGMRDIIHSKKLPNPSISPTINVSPTAGQ